MIVNHLVQLMNDFQSPFNGKGRFSITWWGWGIIVGHLVRVRYDYQSLCKVRGECQSPCKGEDTFSIPL